MLEFLRSIDRLATAAYGGWLLFCAATATLTVFALHTALHQSAPLARTASPSFLAEAALPLLAVVATSFVFIRTLLANVRLRDRIRSLALLDPLTGLHSRRGFVQHLSPPLAAARAEGLPAAFLLIGLDGFKHVNDAHGHAAGDDLLVRFAARLMQLCRPDDHVMRLNGDEFAIVRIGRQQRRDAAAFARFLVDELSQPRHGDAPTLRISASVGAALYPADGANLDDVLCAAKTALHFAKTDGGESYRLFDRDMLETMSTRRILMAGLRDALERNEFEVHYQPLVRFATRQVCGFEALLRWNHPNLGLIMPQRFIPLAEETSVIDSIGEWVLRQACQQAEAWPDPMRVAVNLSPVQFRRSDMADIVTSALRESRLRPDRLELEITEGVAVRDVGGVLGTMRRLRDMGVRIALDDFGTGYASLSYLRCFPVDKVKIDASFLSDRQGGGGTIIRAVLGLCSALGLDSLVEGVETEEQLVWLQSVGCTEVQGNLFSLPMPASGLSNLFGSIGAEGCPA